MAPKRTGFRWTINEILSLQREYELLELSVQEIASRHQRSVESILHKLYDEQITSVWNEARGYELESQCQESDIVKPALTESVITDDSSILNERVKNLESSINDIQYTLNTLLKLSYVNKKKHSPLRKYSTIA
jgi:hypothetical protein